MENPLNLRPRKGAYAYVTWLAPYLAGESNCMYLLYYKMNFFTPKAEADLGDWVEKHTRLVSNIIEEFKDMGGTISVEDENYFNVKSYDRNGTHENKIKPFCEYCQEHTEKEVPDPYYGGGQGFEHVMDLLEDGCRNLCEELKGRL